MKPTDIVPTDKILPKQVATALRKFLACHDHGGRCPAKRPSPTVAWNGKRGPCTCGLLILRKALRDHSTVKKLLDEVTAVMP